VGGFSNTKGRLPEFQKEAKTNFPGASGPQGLYGNLSSPEEQESSRALLSTDSVDKIVGDLVTSKLNRPSSRAFHFLSNF
jgi:hypothetical protein